MILRGYIGNLLRHPEKHVVVYTRSVRPSRQLYGEQPLLEGRPILRKTSEHIELTQKDRSYPEAGDPNAATGPLLGAKFKTVALKSGEGEFVKAVGPRTASDQPMLYGVTNAAGSANLGTIYPPNPPASPGGIWTEAVLYNFTGAADSSYPIALARAAHGTLFGVTAGPITAPIVRFSCSARPPSQRGRGPIR